MLQFSFILQLTLYFQPICGISSHFKIRGIMLVACKQKQPVQNATGTFFFLSYFGKPTAEHLSADFTIINTFLSFLVKFEHVNLHIGFIRFQLELAWVCAQSWLTLCDPIGCQPLCPWGSPGKNTGMDCHFLLQLEFKWFKIRREGHGSTSQNKEGLYERDIFKLSNKASHLAKIKKMKVLVFQSCPSLCDPMDYVAHQAPLSMGFSREEYWSGLPFLSPGDLSDSSFKTGSPAL